MKTILAFGDSNTWGTIPGTRTRFGYDQRWPGIVESHLVTFARVREEGLSGRTTVWDDPFRPGRNGARFLPQLLESHSPIDLLVIMLGTNDLKQYFGLTACDAARGVGTLIELSQSSSTGPEGGPPMVLIIAPPRMGPLSPDQTLKYRGAPRKSQLFTRYYSAVASAFGCHFLDSSTIVSPSLIDGVHLDEEAHRDLGIAVARCSLDLLRPA